MTNPKTKSSSSFTHHPSYDDIAKDWRTMRDVIAGQRKVKTFGTRYLPATPSMVADNYTTVGSVGAKAYEAYLRRARLPVFTSEAIETAIGMLHSQPAKIELPEKLANIKTSRGEDMLQLLRRIHEAQLTTGRIGLFLDLAVSNETGDDLPYITTYEAETAINWDTDAAASDLTLETMNMVVLDECGSVRNGLDWEDKEQYRVLSLGPFQSNDREDNGNVYKFGVFSEGDTFDETQLKPASYRGKELEQIPFIFVNGNDLVATPGQVPLVGLAELCFTIYMAEADYRQNLFQQGQDTLVTIGGGFDTDETVRVGSGARLDLPMGADAKFIGVNSAGLAEQLNSLEEDRRLAGSMGAQSLDTTSRERESGKSMNIRISARTANLNQIALTGGKGLERILRIAAVWIGANPDEVIVEPNLEWTGEMLSGQYMVETATARNLGFPLSAKSLHGNLVAKGMTTFSWEQELAQAKLEEDGPFKRAENGDRNGEQSPEANDGKGTVRNGPDKNGDK